jgi:hypothetical protein
MDTEAPSAGAMVVVQRCKSTKPTERVNLGLAGWLHQKEEKVDKQPLKFDPWHGRVDLHRGEIGEKHFFNHLNSLKTVLRPT